MNKLISFIMISMFLTACQSRNELYDLKLSSDLSADESRIINIEPAATDSLFKKSMHTSSGECSNEYLTDLNSLTTPMKYNLDSLSDERVEHILNQCDLILMTYSESDSRDEKCNILNADGSIYETLRLSSLKLACHEFDQSVAR